jgi:hypothetical protein
MPQSVSAVIKLNGWYAALRRSGEPHEQRWNVGIRAAGLLIDFVEKRGGSSYFTKFWLPPQRVCFKSLDAGKPRTLGASVSVTGR